MRYVVALVLGLLAVRALSALVISQPGYTDAYYYAVVAERVARGEGLTADFIWNFLEAPKFAELPIPSHRFWMPLASVVPALGILALGAPLGDFRAGQLVLVAVAAFIPVVAYAAARMLGSGVGWSLTAGAVAGLGGLFAPGWVSFDSFALAAVLGTGFFIAYTRAWRGSARAGLVAGIAVGLLHLARAEGALFGLALLPLLGRARTRRAGAVGTAVALAIGIGWVVRGLLLAYPQDLLARATLLVRYEDFFAVETPTLATFASALPIVILAKVGALVHNLVLVAVMLVFVLLVPIVVAVRQRGADPTVRAFVSLAAIVYLAQSLVFTLHSLESSFVHSVAAFFPFAAALAASGAQDLFGSPARGPARLVAGVVVAGYLALSAVFVIEWGAVFNADYERRAAVAARLPPGRIVASDAAAWRWITGREALVAPAEGEKAAACVAEIYLAEVLILEPGHLFSAYDELYGSDASRYFTLLDDRDGIRIYAPDPDTRCIVPTTL